ncbi:Gemin2-Brr1 [Babesia duncani]|uniref:Gemin2-Brr1 n=1 Tax=Babesia duncani TaxID=323732 RepID=A0AAD9UNA3_9APIC|nr:Gemin2-Brr1 [Babesia duncani]
MDVESYLAQVRLEEAALEKKIFCMQPSNKNEDTTSVECDGKTFKQFARLQKIDEECRQLDKDLYLTPEELTYFKTLKRHIAKMYHSSVAPEESGLLIYAKSLASQVPNLDASDEENMWKHLFTNTSPPSIFTLCENGISFQTLQEAIHAIANCICENPNLPLPGEIIKWSFTLLVMLDELHAMSETVSYELQRIRRTMLRKFTALQDTDSTEKAELQLIICIIAQEFNQR